MSQNNIYQLSRTISIQGLVTADYLSGRHPKTRIHSHPYAWEMCICIEGNVMVTRDRTAVSLNAGEMLFIQPQTPHEIISEKAENKAFIISFSCNGDLLRPLQNSVIATTQDMTDIIYKLVQELNAAFIQTKDVMRISQFVLKENAPLSAEQMIGTYLEQLLILVLREVTMHNRDETATKQPKDIMQNYLIEQVRTYIQEHIKENLNVSEIAAYFHYSRTHLSVLFKSCVGMSIVEYIIYIRISKAKALLLEQKYSIAQVAEEAGFSSPQYFSHRFFKEVGCSPSQFVERASHLEKESLDI